MKKLTLILLAFFLFGIANTHAGNCSIYPFMEYQNKLHINETGQTIIYFEYKRSIYELPAPRTHFDYIKLERQLIGGQMYEDHIYYKIIYLNILLIKHGYEPIFK